MRLKKSIANSHFFGKLHIAVCLWSVNFNWWASVVSWKMVSTRVTLRVAHLLNLMTHVHTMFIRWSMLILHKMARFSNITVSRAKAESPLWMAASRTRLSNLSKKLERGNNRNRGILLSSRNIWKVLAINKVVRFVLEAVEDQILMSRCLIRESWFHWASIVSCVKRVDPKSRIRLEPSLASLMNKRINLIRDVMFWIRLSSHQLVKACFISAVSVLECLVWRSELHRAP